MRLADMCSSGQSFIWTIGLLPISWLHLRMLLILLIVSCQLQIYCWCETFDQSNKSCLIIDLSNQNGFILPRWLSRQWPGVDTYPGP